MSSCICVWGFWVNCVCMSKCKVMAWDPTGPMLVSLVLGFVRGVWLELALLNDWESLSLMLGGILNRECGVFKHGFILFVGSLFKFNEFFSAVVEISEYGQMCCLFGNMYVWLSVRPSVHLFAHVFRIVCNYIQQIQLLLWLFVAFVLVVVIDVIAMLLLLIVCWKSVHVVSWVCVSVLVLCTLTAAWVVCLYCCCCCCFCCCLVLALRCVYYCQFTQPASSVVVVLRVVCVIVRNVFSSFLNISHCSSMLV